MMAWEDASAFRARGSGEQNSGGQRGKK